MYYQLLADAVVFVHLVFIIFAICGALMTLRWPFVALFHAPAAMWASYIMFSGKICPLTPLENILRTKAGENAYSGEFIEYYIMPIIYPAHLTRELQTTLGLAVICCNFVLYVIVGIRIHRSRR